MQRVRCTLLVSAIGTLFLLNPFLMAQETASGPEEQAGSGAFEDSPGALSLESSWFEWTKMTGD
ncbi:MAG: hypothetical protein ACYTFA_05910 [Planctomycetota bacterium]|jgi:hypothetical protein